MVPPDDDSPSNVYSGQVSEIIDAQPRASGFQPTRLVELFLKDRRAPKTLAELPPDQRLQLERFWPGKDVDRLLQFGDEEEDMPLDIEVATVVDDQGAARYLLWGWNYGAVYLMEPTGLECVAFASQHSVELWNVVQRDLFWAMDRALRRKDHGFQQPMEFPWWDDARWTELAEKPPGTVASEPYIRKWLAGEN